MKVTKAKALERQPFDPDASGRKDHDLWEGMRRVRSLRCWSGGLKLNQSGLGLPKFTKAKALERQPIDPDAWQEIRSPFEGVPRPEAAARHVDRLIPYQHRPAVARRPVAQRPLGFSSRSVEIKSAGVQRLCFGDFHLARQIKVTRPPGRDPAVPHASESEEKRNETRPPRQDPAPASGSEYKEESVHPTEANHVV